ncbi:MAG: hypothetical protein PHY62_03485 [Gallionella sp.]|nr:hypothetical protein [Gallionella sp.]
MSPLLNIKNIAKRAVLLALLCLPISGCAATVGQQFRDIMADIDAQCRKDKQGPYFEQGIPNHVRHSGCDILSIKPVDPLATEEGRFAYSIKLPEPHDKLKAQYFPGIGAETYFKSLCEKDAGEWIFKTVERVEGVFQGRQNYPPSRGSALVYQMYESTEMQTRNMEELLVQPFHGRFNYMERPRDSDEMGKPYVRFFRGSEVPGHYKYGTQKNKQHVYVPYIVNKEQTDILNSRYGFTWRQISTGDMLENGITGGETIIYDRTSNEVLAFRRFFGRVWPRSDSRYTRLTNGDYCQPAFTKGVWPFVQKVLVPINPAE